MQPIERCANRCKQRASHNTVPFGLISVTCMYTSSVQSPLPMCINETVLKTETVQSETVLFCWVCLVFLQRHQSRLAQSLSLETESFPLLLLNTPRIFPQTGSSDVLPVIQVSLIQLLQTNNKNNSVTLTAHDLK